MNLRLRSKIAKWQDSVQMFQNRQTQLQGSIELGSGCRQLSAFFSARVNDYLFKALLLFPTHIDTHKGILKAEQVF